MVRKVMRRGVPVWDLPTRLFHWLLVVLIALQFASGEFGWLPMAWHYRFGYATLALLLFRILWGFAGSTTSRFAGFVRGPRTVARYVADLVHGRVQGAPGHNPLGGWSVIAMLACVMAQAISGLFASDDISEEGPFAGRVSDAIVAWMTHAHHLVRWLLLALIALHIAAVALHWALRGENLVAPMLHGRGAVQTPPPRQAPAARALLLFVLSAAAVWALVAWGEAG